MSLTTTLGLPRRVTSARCSPAAGVDEHESGTGCTGTVTLGDGLAAVTPGDGLAAVTPGDGLAAVTAGDGLGADPTEELEVDVIGDWLGCDAVDVGTHPARTTDAAKASPAWRFLQRAQVALEVAASGTLSGRLIQRA